jgi:hypothetical protein
MWRGTKRLVLVLLGAGLLSACATGAIKSAQQSLDQARSAGAETKAPYEYYSAEAYLSNAEDENAEHDVRAAEWFAQESQKFSQWAMEKGGAK